MIYDYLYAFGPATANELFRQTQSFNRTVQANFHARLGELRDLGVVAEIQERPCKTNGNVVIEWDVTDRLPLKFEKPVTHKCPHCNGKGFTTEQQIKMEL
jgi:hypothetical protein